MTAVIPATHGLPNRHQLSHQPLAAGLGVSKAELLRGAVLAEHAVQEVSTFLDHFPVVWPDRIDSLEAKRVVS